MEKKYKLTEETINLGVKTLHRIEALRDFNDVKKGNKGGFIENEKNLSQSDDCWVYCDAKVYCNAMVYGNAKVYEDARIYGNAKVCHNAAVFGDAVVYGYVMVFGDAMVYDNAKVYDNAQVSGNAEVFGNAEIRGDAEIASNSDYIVFKNWWSSGRYFTWTKSNNMWKVGCFYGTGKELIDKAYKDSELSEREYEKIVKYVESILEVTMLTNLK